MTEPPSPVVVPFRRKAIPAAAVRVVVMQCRSAANDDQRRDGLVDSITI